MELQILAVALVLRVLTRDQIKVAVAV